MEYKDRFTANMWRNGTLMQGETFHAWLEEMTEKSGLDYPHMHSFYQEVKEIYCREEGKHKDHLQHPDLIAITKRVEDAVAKQLAYQAEKEKERKKHPIERKIRQIIRLLRF
jgi:hypothetical protein